MQARNRCLHASLRSVRSPSDFPALRAKLAGASFSASCFDSLVWTAWRRAWRPHTDAGNEGRLAKCRGACAGGSRRFGHSLPASPRMPKSRNTHVIRATANDLLNFLISFLGAGCEERPLAQPFRGGASSCYMEHLKWRARWECGLNPLPLD